MVSEIKYVLVGIFNDHHPEILNISNQYICVNGNWVYVKNIKHDRMIFCYANVDDISMNDKRAASVIGGRICSNYSMPYSNCEYENNFYKQMTSSWPDYDKGKEIIYNENDAINEKITQHHHLFVRPIEVLSLLGPIKRDKDGNKYIKCYGIFKTLIDLVQSVNNIKSTHSTFITYFVSAPTWARKFLLNLYLICKDSDTFKKALKYEGIAAKQLQGSMNNDMNYIFELNVLVNRIDSEVDWVQEKNNRVDIKVAEFDPDDVMKAAQIAFRYSRLCGQLPMKISWDSYWKSRYALTPNGAVHSTYKFDNDAIRQFKSGYRNKKTMLSSIKEFPHDAVVARKPMITAKTSTKYEWGKVRALYGCDITSHLNADFGLAGCESTLPGWMPVGDRANVEYVGKLMESMQNGIPFCYDYDDFNSQHSKESMKAVIRAWLDVYSDNLTDEQIESAVWTMNSINDMEVMDPNGNWIVKGTLFSGWRLTSFINTVLNWVYLYLSGMDKLVMSSIHNGDDVYAVVEKLGDAIALIRETEKHNVRAQVSKMNIGTIAEFLRVDMRAKNKTGAQYLTRATATLVHGRIETEAPNSASSAMMSISTRCKEMLERGANSLVVARLEDIQLNVVKKIFELEDDFKKIYEIDKTQNGFADIVPDGYKVKLIQTGSFRSEAEQSVNLMSPGMHDLQIKFANELDIAISKIDWSIIRKSAEREMNVMKESFRIVFDKSDIDEQRVMHALKGAWGESKGDQIHKLRHITKDILSFKSFKLPGKAEVLAKVDNPLKWLAVLI